MRRDPADYLDQVGAIVAELSALGCTPALLGGLALVLLGSRRATRDFDFVVAQPAERLDATVGLFYDRGFQLGPRVDGQGEVTATIDNRKVAVARLRVDAPSSAYFVNDKTGLRVDLLFDFPKTAASLARAATRTKVRSHVFTVASEEDLLRLKRIAKSGRSSPGDDHDIAFLKARLKRSR